LATRLTEWVANLGYWLVDNNHRQSGKNLWRRLTALGTRRRSSPRHALPVTGYRTRRPRFRAHLAGFRPAPNRTPLTLFRARSQSPWNVRPKCLGWTALGCTVRTVIFPGVDHFDILKEPHLQQLARVLFDILAESRHFPRDSTPSSETPTLSSSETPSRH
jgi:thioesterase domain-containing protein